MNIQKFVDTVYKQASLSKADDFQIVSDYVAREVLNLFEGKVDSQSVSESFSLKLSVRLNGKIGSVVCQNLDEKIIPELIDTALENAMLAGEGEEDFFYDGKGEYQKAKPYEPLLEKWKKLDRLAFLKAVEKEAFALDKRVHQVQKVSIGETKTQKIMQNSLGLNLNEERLWAWASLSLSAKEGEVIQNGFKSVTFEKEEEFSPTYLAKHAVEDAVSRLSEIEISSAQVPVVFENKTFADLLEFLADIVSAKEVQSKKSRFEGKIGQKVAADIVTILDAPLLLGGYSSTSFDGEGYPCYDKEVLKNGVLQTYLHSLKTAQKDKVSPTGNGAGYDGEVCVTNFYLKPQNLSKEALLAEVGNGVYIDRLQGLHAGYNIVSGDFSFGAKGFLLKNGSIDQPLKQFTVSGNYYQMLQNIRLIGDDLEFKTSGFGSPCVCVDGLMIGGK